MFALLFVVSAFASYDLNCTALPAHTATTISDLRPNDIKVVMALGDSITTGFGVRAAANESFGVSFSMGGDPNATTLATYLLQFNANLIGASTGTYPAAVCYGTGCPANQYQATQNGNAAKAGAMSSDMASSQVTYLIRQLNSNPKIDVQNDWKVLTIMVGSDDLCASCTYGLDYLSADDYQNSLFATLERIRLALPRTFVNLVGGFNVSQAYDLASKTSRCNNITRPWFIQCDCLFQPENGAIRETIDASITQFNARAQNVATYYQRKAYDNFAVVFQPFATNTHISDLPSKFLSYLDCFHPSTTGQQAMAVALWNNMLTPSALKKTSMSLTDTPICPTSSTLLYTY